MGLLHTNYPPVIYLAQHVDVERLGEDLYRVQRRHAVQIAAVDVHLHHLLCRKAFGIFEVLGQEEEKTKQNVCLLGWLISNAARIRREHVTGEPHTRTESIHPHDMSATQTFPSLL